MIPRSKQFTESAVPTRPYYSHLWRASCASEWQWPLRADAGLWGVVFCEPTHRHLRPGMQHQDTAGRACGSHADGFSAEAPRNKRCLTLQRIAPDTSALQLSPTLAPGPIPGCEVGGCGSGGSAARAASSAASSTSTVMPLTSKSGCHSFSCSSGCHRAEHLGLAWLSSADTVCKQSTEEQDVFRYCSGWSVDIGIGESPAPSEGRSQSAASLAPAPPPSCASCCPARPGRQLLRPPRLQPPLQQKAQPQLDSWLRRLPQGRHRCHGAAAYWAADALLRWVRRWPPRHRRGRGWPSRTAAPPAAAHHTRPRPALALTLALALAPPAPLRWCGRARPAAAPGGQRAAGSRRGPVICTSACQQWGAEQGCCSERRSDAFISLTLHGSGANAWAC